MDARKKNLRDALRSPLGVWLGLMILSLVSVDVAAGGRFGRFAVGLIFLVGAIKILLVMIHFMELGHAARHWQRLYGLWLVIATTLLIAGHLAGG